jgi:hypothetical protein
VTDDGWIPAYAASVHELVHKHGGKYLSRSGNVKTLEGDARRPESGWAEPPIPSVTMQRARAIGNMGPAIGNWGTPQWARQLSLWEGQLQ